jgi:hypothetical protein
MQRLAYFFLSAIAYSAMALAAHAGDLHLEARLIWGANDEKETVKYERLDVDLSSKLHRMFKWKNYYEITNRTAVIALNQTSELKMSDSCTIRVKNLGDSRVELNFIGQGKQVHKGAYTLEPPQWLVVGGSSTDNTAWFVGLRAVDSKPADKKVASKN